MNQQEQLGPEENAMHYQVAQTHRRWQEAAGVSPEVLWFISLYKIITSTDQEESKANQCKNIVHCRLGCTQVLPSQTSHVLSSICSRKTSQGTTESSMKPKFHTSCTESYCFHYQCVFLLSSKLFFWDSMFESLLFPHVSVTSYYYFILFFYTLFCGSQLHLLYLLYILD